MQDHPVSFHDKLERTLPATRRYLAFQFGNWAPVRFQLGVRSKAILSPYLWFRKWTPLWFSSTDYGFELRANILNSPACTSHAGNHIQACPCSGDPAGPESVARSTNTAFGPCHFSLVAANPRTFSSKRRPPEASVLRAQRPKRRSVASACSLSAPCLRWRLTSRSWPETCARRWLMVASC